MSRIAPGCSMFALPDPFFEVTLTPLIKYDCKPKSSVKMPAMMLVSPYLTVLRTIPFVLCVTTGQSYKVSPNTFNAGMAHLMHTKYICAIVLIIKFNLRRCGKG